MRQFSLSLPDGTHVGFLMMLADDEQTDPSGQLAVRVVQDVNVPRLEQWQNQGALFWEMVGDKVEIHDNHGVLCGTMAQEWLKIDSECFILGDLTGAI